MHQINEFTLTKQDIEILSDQIRGDDQYPNEPQGNVNRRYKDRIILPEPRLIVF